MLMAFASLGGSSSVWAEEADYWTLPEILALGPEIDAQAATICPNSLADPMCYMMARDEVMWSSPQYLAYSNLDFRRMLVTAINPSTSTARIMYLGGDLYNPEDDLSSLFLYWDTDGVSARFLQQYESGSLGSGTHLLYAKSGLEGRFPAGVEIEIPLDEDLSLDPTGRLWYYYITSNGIRYQDGYTYSSCLNHPSYHTGMECRMIFNKSNSDISYIPVEITPTTPENPTPENPNSNDEAPGNSQSGETELQGDIDQSGTGNGQGRAEDIVLASTSTGPDTSNTTSHNWATIPTSSANQANGQSTIATNIPVATSEAAHQADSAIGSSQDSLVAAKSASNNMDGETVSLPSVGEQNAVVFPWWLLILIAIGLGLLFWFFFGLSRRKEEDEEDSISDSTT